jgi:D-xylose transport system permease protein
MLVVILPGQIDLSVGSGVGLIGGISSVLIFEHQLPAPVAMLIGVTCALALWVAMGSLIAWQKVPAFIITLGGLLVFQGVFQYTIHSSTVPVQLGESVNLLSGLTTHYFPPVVSYGILAVVTGGFFFAMWKQRAQRIRHGFTVEDKELFFLKAFVTFQSLLLLTIVVNNYRGLPLALVILGVLAVGIHLLTTQTPFGRYLYAIGGNREAAIISGIPVNRVIVIAYALLGLIVALVGFMQTAYQGSSTAGVGKQMELDAIAACVIGGTSLSGGKGKVLGVIIGALIIGTLINGMTLMSASEEAKLIVRGTVLAFAVWIDVRLNRKQRA